MGTRLVLCPGSDQSPPVFVGSTLKGGGCRVRDHTKDSTGCFLLHCLLVPYVSALSKASLKACRNSEVITFCPHFMCNTTHEPLLSISILTL